MGNLTMTNHPMHLHGHEFVVTGTDGGPTPKEHALARGDDRRRGRPDAPDRVPRQRGRRLGLPLPQEPPHDERDGPRRADHDRRRPPRAWCKQITKLIPDYMVMGERGMADMAEMEMPLPDNTARMMTRRRPVRLGRDGRHVQRGQGAPRPEAAATTATRAGSSTRRARVAYEWTGALAEPARLQVRGRAGRCRRSTPPDEAGSRCSVRKPKGHAGH